MTRDLIQSRQLMTLPIAFVCGMVIASATNLAFASRPQTSAAAHAELTSAARLRLLSGDTHLTAPALACRHSRKHAHSAQTHHARAATRGRSHSRRGADTRAGHEHFPIPGQKEAPLPELPPDEAPLAPVVAPDPNKRPSAPPTDETELSPAQREHMQWAYTFMQSLHFQKGEVTVANGTATLQLGEDFEYLKSEDAQRVLVQVWGNPPDASVLGMIVPANTTPFAPTSWGVAVRYFNIGHVATLDAGIDAGTDAGIDAGASKSGAITAVTTDEVTISFASLLSQLQASTRKQNGQRAAQGRKSVELLRWISAPVYLPALQAIHWGKELRFGQEFTAQPVTTLNYQIRLLGRRGVLELNFVGTREQFTELNAHLPQLLSLAQFTMPNRYSDFDAKTDLVAPGGLVSLITGEPPPPPVPLFETQIFGRPWWLLVPAPLALIVGAVMWWRRRRRAGSADLIASDADSNKQAANAPTSAASDAEINTST